jgi:hypothetical protein
METKQVRIVWSGSGGELDSAQVNVQEGDDYAATNALIALVRNQIVTAGDSFTVADVE